MQIPIPKNTAQISEESHASRSSGPDGGISVSVNHGVQTNAPTAQRERFSVASGIERNAKAHNTRAMETTTERRIINNTTIPILFVHSLSVFV